MKKVPEFPVVLSICFQNLPLAGYDTNALPLNAHCLNYCADWWTQVLRFLSQLSCHFAEAVALQDEIKNIFRNSSEEKARASGGPRRLRQHAEDGFYRLPMWLPKVIASGSQGGKVLELVQTGKQSIRYIDNELYEALRIRLTVE